MQNYSPIVIIGAGQSGLAMSYELSLRGKEHIVLERGQIANSWKQERWDSLRLLTPNWMNGLPGLPYEGDDTTGFMTANELINNFDQCVLNNAVPVQTDTRVLTVRKLTSGFCVQTDQCAIDCDIVVMANGACGIPNVPAFSADLDHDIRQFTPTDYKRPSDLPAGKVLIVGASASGLQLAREIRLAGHDVMLAVGNHLRLPRRYRGLDICTWMDLIGTTGIPYTEVEDIVRVRRTPSLTLVAEETLDLNVLQNLGVEITGRLVGATGKRALFAGSLSNLCVSADLKMNRLLSSIDQWITDRGMQSCFHSPEIFSPTLTSASPRLNINFREENIQSVIWATGYRADFSWLDMPVFDSKGQLMHDGGYVCDGLYVLGLPYLRQRKSTFLHGASEDARALANHICLKDKQLQAA